MKKIVIIIIALLANIYTFSQTAVTGGLTLSTNMTVDADEGYEYSGIARYNAGLTFDIGEDTRHYAFRPGFLFCVKGWHKTGDIDEKQIFENYLVEMPLKWVHKIRLNDNMRLELGYGCFLDVAVHGNVKVKYPELTSTYVINGEPQVITYDKMDKNFKGKLYNIDHGTLLNVGVSTNRYYAGVTCQLGYMQATAAFLFNVGYYFKPCGERPYKNFNEREYLFGN